MWTMAHATLTFRLVGPQQDDGMVRLGDFASTLENLHLALRQVERSVLRRSPQAIYRVSDLKVGSAEATIEEVSEDDALGSPLVVFTETMLKLNRGEEIDQRVDWMVLQRMDRLYQPVVSGRAARLEFAGERLNPQFRHTIRKLLEGGTVSMGSVTGRLERVNVHDRSEFLLYTPVGTAYVRCRFPSRLLDDVRKAIKRNVTVHGSLRSMRGRDVTMFAEVERLEIHPDDHELPTLASLRGVAARYRPRRGVVAAIRALRDAEE